MRTSGEPSGKLNFFMNLGDGNFFQAPLPYYGDPVVRVAEETSHTPGDFKLQVPVECCAGIPMLRNHPPRKIDAWGLIAPTVMREDQSNSVLYFYYPRTKDAPIQLSAKSSDWPERKGELRDDEARIGIQADTPLRTVEFTPGRK